MTEQKSQSNIPAEDLNNLEYFKNLPNQKYLRTAEQSSKKFRSHDGAAKRAIMEKAMLQTEGYKFSKRGQAETKGMSTEEKDARMAYVFQKFCTFYAYSDEALKYRRGIRDIMNEHKAFYNTYTSEDSRAIARQIKVRNIANQIDKGDYRGYAITRFYKQHEGQSL